MVAENLEPAFRATKRTDLDDLNELIDWYEKFKPEAGKSIPIWKTPEQLAKMLGTMPTGNTKEGKPIYAPEQPYRGRMISAVGPRK